MSRTRFKELGAGSFFGELVYEWAVPVRHFLRELERVVDWKGIAVRTGFCIKERLELGRRWAIPTQECVDLPASTQSKQKHQHTCCEQRWQGVGDVQRMAGVRDRTEKAGEAPAEAPPAAGCPDLAMGRRSCQYRMRATAK